MITLVITASTFWVRTARAKPGLQIAGDGLFLHFRKKANLLYSLALRALLPTV